MSRHSADKNFLLHFTRFDDYSRLHDVNANQRIRKHDVYRLIFRYEFRRVQYRPIFFPLFNVIACY